MNVELEDLDDLVECFFKCVTEVCYDEKEEDADFVRGYCVFSAMSRIYSLSSDGDLIAQGNQMAQIVRAMKAEALLQKQECEEGV